MARHGSVSTTDSVCSRPGVKGASNLARNAAGFSQASMGSRRNMRRRCRVLASPPCPRYADRACKTLKLFTNCMSPCLRSRRVQKRLAKASTTSKACCCVAVMAGMAVDRGIRGVPTSGALTSWHIGTPFEKNRVGPSSRYGSLSLRGDQQTR
jgi:hypothetical protein